MPHLPVSDMDRYIAYYQDPLGFRLAWRTVDSGLAALVGNHDGVPRPAQPHHPDTFCRLAWSGVGSLRTWAR
ncbi:MAG: VOC family protein [Acidimicrobiales bacterium]